MEEIKMELESVSEKDWVITLVLVLLGGSIGLHHFYCGRVGKGILYIFTLGLFGIGVLVDLILIVMKKYKDSNRAIVCNSKILDS